MYRDKVPGQYDVSTASTPATLSVVGVGNRGGDKKYTTSGIVVIKTHPQSWKISNPLSLPFVSTLTTKKYETGPAVSWSFLK